MFIWSDSDAIIQITHNVQWLQNAHLNIILYHVKVHQDDGIQYSELTQESQLNVDAYLYATNYVCEGEIISYDEDQENPMSFCLNDHIINRNIKNKFKQQHNHPNHKHIWFQDLRGIKTHLIKYGGQYTDLL